LNVLTESVRKVQLRETEFFTKKAPEFQVLWAKGEEGKAPIEEEKLAEIADEIPPDYLKPFVIMRELEEENAVLRKRIRKALQDSEELEMLQKESCRLREEIDGYRARKGGK
jgi:hypothetical protein